MSFGPRCAVLTNELRLREQPFSLCLSAGFFGFFAHTGVLAELEARDLKPERVMGASAGALAGGLWAMGIPTPELSERLMAVQRQDFWDPGRVPLFGILRGNAFEAILDDMLADLGRTQLEEAATPITTIVWDLARRSTVHLDSGKASRAIRASCALPVMFRPVRVNRRWVIDGGASDREATSPLRVDERALMVSLPHHSPWPEFGVSNRRVAGPRRFRFVPQDLPKVSPWALDQGPAAMAEARRQFAEWLALPVKKG